MTDAQYSLALSTLLKAKLINFSAEDVLVCALNTLQAASQESNNWELTKLQLVKFSFVIVSQLH